MKIPNSPRSALKLMAQKLVPTTMLVLMAVSVGMTILTALPKHVYAFNTDKDLTITEQNDRTILYALGFCLTANHDSVVFQQGLKDQVSAAELNGFDIYVGPQSIWSGGYEVAVGHEIVTKTGTQQCKQLDHTAALRFVGMTPQEYRDALYQQDGNSTNYKLKSGANQAMDKRLQDLRNAKRDQGPEVVGGAVGPEELARRVAISLAQCITAIPDGQVATHTTVKIGDKTYQYRDGKDSGSRISMGHDLSRDGAYTCGKLVDLAQPNNTNAIGKLPPGITIDMLHDDPTILRQIYQDGKNPNDVVAANAGSGKTDNNSCEAKGGLLAWIVCPVVKALDEGIATVDDKIISLLNVPEDNFTGSGPNAVKMQAAAARIRDLTYIILIPIMLFMVIGTALGFEFLSAYTIKKAFPRLVAATIFVALSSQITFFLIQITNTVGKGIAGIMLQPFLGTTNVTLSSILTAGQGAGLSGAAVGAFVGLIIVLGPSIIGIILSYAFITFVVLFLGFAILAIRQVAVLLLALLAPLAILAWIFPGNDKVWKLWWSSFSKLLIMYPLIVILINAGKVFASLVPTAGEKGILGSLIVVTAYIAPYFFIPATFKFAGGAFASLTGAINNRGKGLFDRQKATRGKLASDAFRDFKGGTAGGKYNPRRVASMTVGRGLGAGWKGRYGFGKTGAAARANQSNAEPEEVAKENINFAREMVDEEAMASVSMGNNVDKMMELEHFRNKGRAYTEGIAARGRAVGNTRRVQVAAAKQLAKSGKIIKNHEEARALFASASGGDAGLAGALKGNLQYTWRGVGRNDIGRDDIADSLSEMSINDMSRMKPLGAEGMFDDPEKISAAIASNKLNSGQREHAVTLLHAATNSPYLNPKQQASARRALDALEQSANMVIGADGQGISVGRLVQQTRARAERLREDPNQRALEQQEADNQDGH